jgi:hypothetical protein
MKRAVPRRHLWRRNERAAFKGERARDREWWKPLALLPERIRIHGRRLSRLLTRTREDDSA